MKLRKLIPLWRTITHITVNDPVRIKYHGTVHRAELHVQRTWLGIGGLVKEQDNSIFCYSPSGRYWHLDGPSGDYVPDSINKQICAAHFEQQYKEAQVDSAFNTLKGHR